MEPIEGFSESLLNPYMTRTEPLNDSKATLVGVTNPLIATESLTFGHDMNTSNKELTGKA